MTEKNIAIKANNDKSIFIQISHLTDVQNNQHISKGIFQKHTLATQPATVTWNKRTCPGH